ncbi:DUF3857 domain-containing protein [Flavobacterium sp.]|uniref:DUF3857 domain-containing protein n=1 Tax=Flavobacterium sp. TaxID=239 RepID=UPI00263150DC|nr:DUF3857 domain-containing protein [Flavobacterium sp.]
MSNIPFKYIGILLVFCSATFATMAQVSKPKSYIISKSDYYTLDVKSNAPSVTLFSEERKWVGDKDNREVIGNRIDYSDSFEEVSDIEAYSLSPEKKKEKVRNIITEDREIENIFYHDQKFKYYYFSNLKEGSETYSSYKKQFRKPQFLDPFYFKDGLECKDAKITLKVANTIDIGYVLLGNDTEKVQFTTQKEGDFNIYSWQLTDSDKEEVFESAPSLSYYSPHLIYYIKNYRNDSGTQNVVGSVDNLYKFYYQTIKDINKTDQSSLKTQTQELIKGLTTELEKTKAIFDFVQTKVHYVAFEDGMGGYIPREAADVFQKKYGDCKDMANLLNEMLHVANIESYTAWIGTRQNNYTYEKVPTPIVDNHMIAVAKISGQYYFLDATGQYTLFPGFTPFIQGKQALLKIDEQNYKIVPVPVVDAVQNNTAGKIRFQIEGNKLTGKADFELTGFLKTQFIAYYKATAEKEDMLKSYLSRFIGSISTSNIEVKNDDLTQNPLQIQYQFGLEKWVKSVENELVFKPILFFPYADSRIDIEKRKAPITYDFKKAFNFEYEVLLPEGYQLSYKPDDFNFSNNMLKVNIKYTAAGNKILVSQKMELNTLLVEKDQFESWNTAIKSITKQYNQNIILTKS